MPAFTEANTVTFQNLSAAFDGESNAHARYIAFAAKADEEELHGVASLFRAAARSEQIHAANHAHVINQWNLRAECAIPEAVVSSTLENLKTALNGEKYEIDIMYPGFLEEASERKNMAAVRSFTGALEAEKTHAQLFSEAIALLAAGKKDSPIGIWLGEAREFYVCPVCGYTSETEEEHERCPVCNCPWEKFEIIR